MKTDVLLTVDDLTTTFMSEGSITTAVDHVSFSVNRGEVVAIVGESGSGKSVTALSILQLVPCPPGRISSRAITYDDPKSGLVRLDHLSERQMQAIRGKEISMVFQEPMTSLNPVFTCGDQVMESLRNHLRLGRKEAQARVHELFREVRLPRPEEIFRAYPHQVSGGQKQRVMIAMAMACNPGLLIADEPTTALDVSVQKTILELLGRLQQERKMSILFITHDLGLVKGFADRVIVMLKGKILEDGPVAKIFDNPAHPYTRGLIACRPPGGRRIRRLPTLADFMEGGEVIKGMETFSDVSREERKSAHDALYMKEPVLKVESIDKYYTSSHGIFTGKKKVFKALDGVSMDIYPEETLGIVGESGCGKTTLARVVLRLLPSSAGRILYKGQDITLLTPRLMKKLRKEIQIVFQDPYASLNPRMTVGQAILEPMKVHGLFGNDNERRQQVVRLLEQVGLDSGHFRRYPHEFSGGQRQRICIARALAVQPEVIILDESVSALDVSVQAQVLNLLNDLKKEYHLTYLFISHDLSVIRFMSDRVIVMKDGRIEESGEADALYDSPVSEYTKMLLAASSLIK